MPRSTTVWAAALVLASFSGSGPLLTTAEAMPAPGPQETQGRPRYYFPRHVKRQIVTNSTAPAAPTLSSSSSSSQQLESRQLELPSFLNPALQPHPDTTSSITVSKSESNVRTSTVTSIQEIIVTPVPDQSEPLPGTGNLRASPVPGSSAPAEVIPPPSSPSSSNRGSTGRLLDPIVRPSPASTPSPQEPKSEEPEIVPSSPERVGSSTGLPPVIVQPTPSPKPEPESSPVPVESSSAPRASSPPAQNVASTGRLPDTVLQPTSAPQSVASRSDVNTPPQGSTGRIPEIIIPATSAVPSSAPASSADLPEVVQPTPSASAPARNPLESLLGGLVGSSGGVPSSVVQPTPAPEAPVSSGRSGQRVGSTGGVPEVIVPASSSPVASPEPSPPAASSFLGPFLVPGSTGGVPQSVLQPTPSQGPLGGLLSSIVNVPEATPNPQVGSTGVLPSIVVLPTPGPASPSSEQPLLVSQSSGGIVVGITTALGTGAASPTPASPLLSSGAIPTSEAVLPSSGPLDLPSILSSLVSEVTGILPSGSAGPTAPVTPTPAPTPPGILPPLVSSLVSDVSSLLSSAVPDLPGSVVPSIVSSLVSDFPTATAPIPLPPASSIASSIVSDFSGIVPTPSGVVPTPSGIVPTPSGAVPSPSESAGITPLLPSETPSVAPSAITPPVASATPSESVSVGITPPAASETPSGVLPSGSGTGVSSGPVVTPSAVGSISVPASEAPISTPSPVAPSSATVVPPSSGNATISEAPTSLVPTTSFAVTDSATIPIPTIPVVTSKPTPVNSQKPIGFDSATSMAVGTSIIQETTSNAAPSPTSSGIPSSLPKMIAPPGGVPNDISSTDSFMGQVCFKWPLNYPFVSANDGGNQIFHYLPKAVADGLNISSSDVRNMGLRPLDTTASQGFITTIAQFTIPKDLQGKLAAQLRNPADVFWHNKDQTVNDLTNLINTACPLPAGGKLPGDSSNPNQAANPAAAPSGGAGDGGALGGDIGASRPINGSAAGIATGAIVGAIAYGAAMFFVARRYRNKRIAHQRSSSVPSTGTRNTFGSIPGGAAAWMHGARNGRMTPGSRGSHGSSSSQGRSVRTQQISAPVMAENSLGWN